MWRSLLLGLVVATILSGSAISQERSVSLDLPLACEVGKSCFIQQYLDHDPGSGAKDYRCGALTYDGHDGVDIRLNSIAAQKRGVAVLAAASGTVRATRNDMPDGIVPHGDPSVKGRECGNGLLIEHPDGWQTQYCHMAKGSVSVQPGQEVKAGDRLGMVGLSGNTQFPHLHLTVRHGKDTVDPFAPGLAPGMCGAGGGAALWSPKAAKALAYRATEIINSGFATGPVNNDAVEREGTQAPTPASPALVFYARAIGLQGGDVMRLTITRPDGQMLITNDTPMDRNKAQWLAYVGKKRPPEGWMRGGYRGECAIVRGGKPVVVAKGMLGL
jgi:hypothetical protein